MLSMNLDAVHTDDETLARTRILIVNRIILMSFREKKKLVSKKLMEKTLMS